MRLVMMMMIGKLDMKNKQKNKEKTELEVEEVVEKNPTSEIKNCFREQRVKRREIERERERKESGGGKGEKQTEV